MRIDPASDQGKLIRQETERPGAGSSDSMLLSPREVYSEDWWSHARPILEIHGYFRTRGELYHNFALNRHEPAGVPDGQNLWRQPLDNSYQESNGTTRSVQLCSTFPYANCSNNSQSTANMRLRLMPELHISDNLRVITQIDFLDNLVLGSTPEAYQFAQRRLNPYAPYASFSQTQGPPTSGVNAYRNSIEVKRAWAEYMFPFGQVRFGRMPNHWGLGMMWNAGDSIDDDWQTTTDRIMFTSGLRQLDLYFGGSWDFVSSGPTNATAYDIYGGQPYNTANLTNVDQWSAFVARKVDPELQKLQLSRGEFVINGGLTAYYRQQTLDVDSDNLAPAQVGSRGVAGSSGEVAAARQPVAGQIDTRQPSAYNTAEQYDAQAANNGLVRRGMKALIPDLWIQIKWRKFRFEGELAHVRGEIGTTTFSNDTTNPIPIRQWGLVTQTEWRGIEDKLKLQFGFGWSSGDPWTEGLNPGPSGLQVPGNNRGPLATFRMNPAYMVDQILWRKIMTRVQGAYYFRPSVDYDFIRTPKGEKVGGGAAIIWSRASEFTQAPGNKRDLGVELDLNIYYQAKDGSLNDNPDKLGGFFAMLQYGVFFPFGGLETLANDRNPLVASDSWDLKPAQTARLFLGVAF